MEERFISLLGNQFKQVKGAETYFCFTKSGSQARKTNRETGNTGEEEDDELLEEEDDEFEDEFGEQDSWMEEAFSGALPNLEGLQILAHHQTGDAKVFGVYPFPLFIRFECVIESSLQDPKTFSVTSIPNPLDSNLAKYPEATVKLRIICLALPQYQPSGQPQPQFKGRFPLSQLPQRFFANSYEGHCESNTKLAF